MNSLSTQRRFGLDLLRCTAITCVLLSHMVNGFEWLGFLGVEIFFTLSGFLIGCILLRSIEKAGRFGLRECREFLKRRWFRTLPNYYLFLIIFTIIQYFHPIDGTVRLGEFPYYLVFLQSFAWPKPSFFGVSWSLCVEEWFYVLLASGLLVILPLFSTTARRATSAMLAMGATFVVLPLVLRLLYPMEGEADSQRFIVIYRLDAIMYGVLMSCAKARLPDMWITKRHTAFGVGLAMLIAASLTLSERSPTQFAILLSLAPLSLCLLLPLTDCMTSLAAWWSRAVESVSIWSYSIYLCHIPIYIGLKPVLGYEEMSSVNKLVYKAGCLVAIVGTSGLLYHFFEKPITDLRDRTRVADRAQLEPLKA